jgi:hypothetical protein
VVKNVVAGDATVAVEAVAIEGPALDITHIEGAELDPARSPTPPSSATTSTPAERCGGCGKPLAVPPSRSEARDVVNTPRAA